MEVKRSLRANSHTPSSNCSPVLAKFYRRIAFVFYSGNFRTTLNNPFNISSMAYP